MMEQLNSTSAHCKRCGTCCARGGPALHIDDIAIVQKGRLGWNNLVTFLAGEPAWDPAAGKLILLPIDTIKIRSFEGKQICSLYDSAIQGCSIYQYRPVECRVLKCWNTREIENMFLRDMLSREDILADDQEMLNAVIEYNSHYGADTALRMIERFGIADHPSMVKVINEAENLRSTILSRFSLETDVGDFILGRKMNDIISGLCAAQRYGL